MNDIWLKLSSTVGTNIRKSQRCLDEIEALDLPGGVVLTGGAARLPGVVDLAEDILEPQLNCMYRIKWA